MPLSPGTALTPAAFAAAYRRVVESERGHAAHRLLDLLTNDVLRALGYGEGIDIFEAAVAHWHGETPYPHIGPCPDCEQDRGAAEVERPNA